MLLGIYFENWFEYYDANVFYSYDRNWREYCKQTFVDTAVFSSNYLHLMSSFYVSLPINKPLQLLQVTSSFFFGSLFVQFFVLLLHLFYQPYISYDHEYYIATPVHYYSQPHQEKILIYTFPNTSMITKKTCSLSPIVQRKYHYYTNLALRP